MTLTVKFNDGYGEECLLGLDSWEIESTEATRDLSGYSFPGGFTTIYIYVTGPLKAEMQLRASIGDYTATSDARSIYQVWEKALEDDFGGMVVNGEVRNYIEQVLSFSESAETFAVIVKRRVVVFGKSAGKLFGTVKPRESNSRYAQYRCRYYFVYV